MANAQKPNSLRNGCSRRGPGLHARQLWLFQPQTVAPAVARGDRLVARRAVSGAGSPPRSAAACRSTGADHKRSPSPDRNRVAASNRLAGSRPVPTSSLRTPPTRSLRAATRADDIAEAQVTTLMPRTDLLLRVAESLSIVALVVLFLSLACLAT